MDDQTQIALERVGDSDGLTAVERKLRDTVEGKNVSWFLYRVPEEIAG